MTEFSNYEMMRMSLSNFNLIRKLGYGAYGEVWLSEYINNKKLYALKIIERIKSPLNINSASDLSLKINHINLMKVYNHFFENLLTSNSINPSPHMIIIMEYIKGDDLYFKIRRGEIINLKKYIPQLLNGIEYLHENKIVHRDIKPENIIIDEKDNVKIIDYDFLTNNYQLRSIVGTPLYAAPEIYSYNKYYDEMVDLWSLGILIWCVIEGREPFMGENHKELKEQVLNEEPDWSQVEDDYYYHILKGLLEKNPSNRWSIEQIREVIKDKKKKILQ